MKDGGESGLTGKKRGDAYHKALEMLDFTASPDDAAAELDRIYSRGGLTAAERACVQEKDISAFLGSEVCRRAAACGKDNIYKEHPLFYEPSDSELREICLKYGIDIPEWQYDEKPVIQGITDLFFIENGEIVLVDYKTNTHVTEKDLIDEYRGQLAVYAHALEESMGMRVKERILYSFWLGRGVTVTPL
jgi:ATP-dependent helicase/nuclease subunit A